METGAIQAAKAAFETNVPDETLAYQNELILRGKAGQIAFGLFRAQKRSTKAKSYRRRAHRSNAYDGKGEALRYLDAALDQWGDVLGIRWGWRLDPKQAYHNQVLYVELPEIGQCSFHSDRALSDKEFEGQWDTTRSSQDVVLDLCDRVMAGTVVPLGKSDLMPFGKMVGVQLGDLLPEYCQWLSGWSGLASWSSVEPVIRSRCDSASSRSGSS